MFNFKIMKKFLLLILFACATFNGFCQTITLNDLKFLLKGKEEAKFLTDKSFTVVDTKFSMGHNVTTYVINSKTPKAEFILTGLTLMAKDGKFYPFVRYMTRDTSYVNTIIKQVNMAGFTLAKKKYGKTQNMYEFDNQKFYVVVEIKRMSGFSSIIDLHNKF